MNIEAGTEQILKLLLGEGKDFTRMDPILLRRFLQAITYILISDDLAELSQFGSLDVKFFDGHYQIKVDGEKRMWFEEKDGEIVVTYFGSTDHKHGNKR